MKEFQRKPYVKKYTLDKYKDKMLYIQNEINKRLIDYKDFDGIDFCDVCAGGIQIRGHHKKIIGYIYGNQPTIKYDFSNVEEVICEFVEMWKRQDNPKDVESYLNFLRVGEDYGWD